MPMITSTRITFVTAVPGMPIFSNSVALSSRMTHVLIAIQPVGMTSWKNAGR